MCWLTLSLKLSAGQPPDAMVHGWFLQHEGKTAPMGVQARGAINAVLCAFDALRAATVAAPFSIAHSRQCYRALLRLRLRLCFFSGGRAYIWKFICTHAYMWMCGCLLPFQSKLVSSRLARSKRRELAEFAALCVCAPPRDAFAEAGMWRRGVQMARQLRQKVGSSFSSVTSTMDSDLPVVEAATVGAISRSNSDESAGQRPCGGCKDEVPGGLAHPCCMPEGVEEQRNTYEDGPDICVCVGLARGARNDIILFEDSVCKSAPPTASWRERAKLSRSAKVTRCELQGALSLVPGAQSERVRPLPGYAQPARMF